MSQARRITLEEKVAFLRDPSSYPGRVHAVEAIETHFAWVFLTDHHAYKLKKPVRHERMDYRTLRSREHGCREELRLNKPLAPRVYLSVVPLTRRDGALALAKQGQIEDWLIRMRRLPHAQMLDRVLTRRTLRAGELDQLVATLARFFAHATPAAIEGAAYLKRLQQGVPENWRALRAAGPGVRQGLAKAVVTTQRQFLRKARRALAARAGKIVDGHGDLRAEHVCLTRPLCIIDRLEFSRELRELDPAEEIAFLALEIERIGRTALAQELVRRFRTASEDDVSAAIVHFYMSHRAATRAKLAVWHIGDPQFPDPRPWTARANSYLRDARRHARAALRLLAQDESAVVARRPAFEQRRERRAAHHARERLPEKRPDRQHGQPAGA